MHGRTQRGVEERLPLPLNFRKKKQINYENNFYDEKLNIRWPMHNSRIINKKVRWRFSKTSFKYKYLKIKERMPVWLMQLLMRKLFVYIR